MMRRAIGGWKLHDKDVLGVPDFFFLKERLAVFVDGCFWHGCRRCGHIPKTSRAYWKSKIRRNLTRDELITRKLRASGFHVVRLRECDLKNDPGQCIRRVQRALSAARQTL